MARAIDAPESPSTPAPAFTFIAPVYPGDAITSKMKIVDKWVKRDHQYLAFRIESRNQNGVLVAEKYHASVWPSENTVRPSP